MTITCAALLALCVAYAAAQEVQVETLHMPEKCDIKSQDGDSLSVHYTLKLTDGTKVDSSLDRNTPFEFQLGKKMVIPGWEQGMQGMCEGEKRRLTIPPELGYGSRNLGSIPPNSVLDFTTELLKITRKVADEL